MASKEERPAKATRLPSSQHVGGALEPTDREAASPLHQPSKPAASKIDLNPGAMLLVIVRDGKVIHYSGNLLLSHMEFVKRKTGELPEGAWVGTVHKLEDGITAFTSKTFYGYELPAPDWVMTAVRAAFT